MSARAVRYPSQNLWILVGLLILGLAYRSDSARFHGPWLIGLPLLALAVTLVLRRLWELPPAVTMCAAIALTIFAGGWSLMGFGGVPLNRLLVAFVLLQIFLRAPGVLNTPRLQLRKVHLLMGITVLYALGSAAASGTLTSKSDFLILFDVFGIAPYLLFLAAPAVFAGDWERNLLLITLVGLGAYLGLTAIFESVGPHVLVFPSYIHHADLETPGELKAGGPFQSAVAEGFATFACAVAAVLAFFQWAGQRKQYFAAIVAVICAFGCFLTLERGVWIAAVAAAAITALMTRSGRRLLAPALLISIVAVVGILTISPALAHRTSGRATDQASVWDRQNQTNAGLRMVAAKPLLGFGFDRYVADSVEYFRQASNYPLTGYVHGLAIDVPQSVLPLHDTYLAYAVELGLIGFLLWLVSLLWAVGEAILIPGPAPLRPWKLGLLAVSVFFFVISVVDPHTAPFPTVLLFIWAGVATGTAPLTSRVTSLQAFAGRAREQCSPRISPSL